MTDTPTRRLAAILCADVVGFSRMVQADEEGTLSAIRLRRAQVIEPTVARHEGRVFKQMGDGFLAEFASVVNAVRAALELQVRMAGENASLPPDRHIVLRIGINLGDILGEGEDVFGDGVNIAARLEPLAPPGGIVVSAKVQAEVQGKTDASFTDMGEQALKNIAAPVRIYRVVAGAAAPPPQPQADTRLSVAVLPFTSLGADPDQQYFGDGVTEDIITELARLPILHVASRNASFRFRGPDADIAAAARTLGVRFIVEGSVRRLGPRMRITAQLVDTATGAHLWAERYDRPSEAIFDAQDEVVRSIVGTLTGRLQTVGAEVARAKPEATLSATDLILQAEALNWFVPEGREKVLGLARRALAIEPDNARAELLVGMMIYLTWLRELDEPRTTLDLSLPHMRRSVALDPGDFYCHIGFGEVCLHLGEHDLAERHFLRAAALNPNRPAAHLSLAMTDLYAGHPDAALERMAAARKIDPNYDPFWLWIRLGIMEYVARRYSMASEMFRRSDTPDERMLAFMAAAHAMQGDDEGAQAATEALRRLNPGFTTGALLERLPFRHKADRDHIAEGMRRAGLPE